KRRIEKPIAAQRLSGGAQRNDLGVCSGVAGAYGTVPALSDDRTVLDDHRTDRDFARPLRLARELERTSHETQVEGIVLRLGAGRSRASIRSAPLSRGCRLRLCHRNIAASFTVGHLPSAAHVADHSHSIIVCTKILKNINALVM